MQLFSVWIQVTSDQNEVLLIDVSKIAWMKPQSRTFSIDGAIFTVDVPSWDKLHKHAEQHFNRKLAMTPVVK